MSESKEETTKVVREGVERASKEFSTRVANLGFQRTKKMLWTRRQPFFVDFIHFHRGGSSYGAPINFSVDIRVHFGIRVLNDAFSALSLNGPSSDSLTVSGGRYHLRFNAKSNSTFDRCVDDLARFVFEQGEPWFQEFSSVEALLEKQYSPLSIDDKEFLSAAVVGNTSSLNVAASMKMLGIK